MSATHHIEWLNLVEKTGPFLAVGVLDEAFPQGLDKVETRQRQRVRSAYDEWRDAVDADDPQLDAIPREWVRLVLQELLDYDSSVLKPQSALPETVAFLEPLTGVTVRPDYAALSGETPRLLVARFAPDTDLSAPLANDSWIASPIERMNQLCRALGVRLGLVTDGERWVVVSVPADGGSSVATWFARIWQQEPVTLQAFVSLLGVRRCFGKAEDTFDSLLQRSQGHQNEITDTLGEQVRRAVEVLVQALDQADVSHNRQLLVGVTPGQLYEAGLTVMMRLVILLCAEQRKLLLLGEETYDQHYAVTTLRARLAKEQTDLTDEVLERRHDAWSRLLAVCRAVYGGIEHSTLRLPPLGGSLFDPDRFPFLEGRAAGTSWRDTPASPLPIDNRTVLMLLTALQVLEQSAGAQMLSYEALDVEQIGHVYEGLLERTVKRVPEVTLGLIGSAKSINPVATLHQLEEQAASGTARLVSFLEERTGRSVAALSKAVEKPIDDALSHRIAIACGSSQSLAPRLRPFARLLREDNWKRSLVYKADSFIVTLGAGRRETGTHYTPRSLTEPIVQHTLEPLVYIGPAEGKPQAEWQLRTPADLLALKICDMAMGSAAFLVQVCRYMGERLVEGWEAQEKAGKVVTIEGVVLEQGGSSELLPKDRSERTLIARRLIASRCLYGVDINPMAVELAKVSLWLVTMMKGRPFNFLDHALKCGDSLLGVSSVQQIENFSLRPGERQITFATANLFRYVDEASAKRRALEDLPSNDHTQIEAKNRLNAEAEAATAKVKALADCLIAFELLGLDGEAYEEQRADEAEKMQLLMKRDSDVGIQTSTAKSELAHAARKVLRGRSPFHWSVEFPEVFALGGFDAFVGNPPFMGGTVATTTFGSDYMDLIRSLYVPWHGKADLAGLFLRRSHLLASSSGYAGFITTAALLRGETCDSSLRPLVASDVKLFRARRPFTWPGGAAVTAIEVFLSFGPTAQSCIRDGVEVGGIGPDFEIVEQTQGEPRILSSSLRGFLGVKLAPNNLRIPSPAPQVLVEICGANLKAAVGCNELYGLCNYSDAGAVILADQMRPNDLERVMTILPSASATALRFSRPAKELREKIEESKLCFACGETLYKQLIIAQIDPSKHILKHTAVGFPCSGWDYFSIIQSCLHEAWTWKYGLRLRDFLRYSPKRCSATFPAVETEDQEIVTALTQCGFDLFAHRSRQIANRNEGLTRLYNRFHDRREQSEDIARLRALHVEMDQAVAAAYGWSDLDLGHGFHVTKQGERYTISEPARRSVLDRLLALNHQRYAEEVKAGLHDKRVAKKKRATARSNDADVAPELIQGELI
jgi:hypothetical protein